MSSNAVAGVGTVFQRWSGAAWVAIGEINSITGPSMSRDTIDVTSLSSTGGYREFIAGFRNPGTVQLSMNFTRAPYELFKTDFESNTIKNYRIVLPDAENTSVEFMGLVTELPMTIPADDKITCDVTIQLSGPIDMDSGSSAGLGLP
jgi:predicted secreted protein